MYSVINAVNRFHRISQQLRSIIRNIMHNDRTVDGMPIKTNARRPHYNQIRLDRQLSFIDISLL